VREESGRFLVEGPQGLRAAVRRPDLLEEVYVTATASDRYADLLDEAASAGAAVVAVDDQALAAMAETVSPQGVVAVCRTVTVSLPRRWRVRRASSRYSPRSRTPGTPVRSSAAPMRRERMP
jgi:RNA methyltransferase, TrmH family